MGEAVRVAMSRRPFRYAAALMAAASLMAACSGSGSESSSSDVPVTEPPTTTEVVEEPETTTTSTTTTTTTSTTTTSTTTLPEPVVNSVPATDNTELPADTTVVPNVAVPSNTTFDPATLEGEVEQTTLADLTAFSECLAVLPNCDPVEATRFALLEYASGNVELINGWNADGLEIRDNDTWTFVVYDVEFNSDKTEALAYVCSQDGSSLVKPATGASDEEIVDPLDKSFKSKYLVRRINDAWAVTAAEDIETIEGREEGYCG